jgi:peptide deformylase
MMIYLYGSDTLRKKCDVVGLISPDFQDLLYALQQTADDLNTIGLAANQIGFFKRAIIVRSPGYSKIFVNPEIIWKSEGVISMQEGCLSIPLTGVMMPVITRYRAITLKYQDAGLVHHESTYKDFPAAVIQHEIDHLDGVLMIDLASSEWRRKNKRHLRNIRQGLITPNYDACLEIKGKTKRFLKSKLEI